jgi:hypothetical protein
VLLAALHAAMAVEPASAQEWAGSGRVKGVVTDTDGEPIRGALVTYRMVQDRDTGPAPFVTDKRGRYSFHGLRGGLWFVRAEAEGFDVWEGTSEVFSSGAPEVLEIELTSGSGNESGEADETVRALWRPGCTERSPLEW